MMTDASSVSRRKTKNATTLKMSWKATMAAAAFAAGGGDEVCQSTWRPRAVNTTEAVVCSATYSVHGCVDRWLPNVLTINHTLSCSFKQAMSTTG
jgi:hypothetical protein